MNAHTGNKLRVAIAQKGIFFRVFAATTYAGSGFGGGGGATSAASAGAADEVEVFATSFDALGSADGVPPESTDRRSLDRLRR
jgi:hypothetical protein